MRESEEEDMTERKPSPDQSTQMQFPQAADEPTARKRFPLGLWIYGILTTLGGLALLVVE